jgi:superfamily I DNA and RNA helicase
LKYEIKVRIDEKEENKVIFERVHRYKGLEAPIIILTNIDKFNLNEIGLIYTVLTRASVALYILGTKEDLGKLQIVPDNILKVA